MKKLMLSALVLFLFTPGVSVAFTDLSDSHPYYSALVHLNNEGIITGYSDGTVRPDNEINRAEMVKVLVEGLGYKVDPNESRNCFPDVKEEWFAKYVCFAREHGWIDGYPDGGFYPEKNINRAEALKIILNAFEFVSVPPENDPFSDVSKDLWFAPFVGMAKEKNLLPEVGVDFEPWKIRTRGEVAEIISRIILVTEAKKERFESWPADLVDVEIEILNLINKLRADDFKAPLVINHFLTKVARDHSRDMAENIGELQHESSNGKTAGDRIKGSGAKNVYASAENIGSGTFTVSGRSVYDVAEDVHLNIFMNEPDTGFNHKTTLLSRSFPFTEIGVGVYVKENKMYFTTDFISVQGQ